MNRFNRDFLIQVDLRTGRYQFKPPMRIAFDCQKSVGGGLNKLTLKIYNLIESKRLELLKDPEDPQYIPFIFKAGYEGSLLNLFKGNIHTARTERSGTDFITTIEVLDGGYDTLNSFTSTTVTSNETAINSLLNDMPHTSRGRITSLPALIRPKVLVGNSTRLIEDHLQDGESFFIDDERLYILRDNEVVGSFIPVVSPETGLINTPERSMKQITFETMLNPSIKIGNLVDLKSSTAPHLNGKYKVESISYKGDNYGNDWRQTVTGQMATNYNVVR
jgi:hypothetical protein